MSPPLNMPTPIYDSGAGEGTRWRITHYNSAPGSSLIHFQKWGRSGSKSLDQVARWVSAGWDSSRWVPRPPTVPAPVLRAVMAELVRREVMG